MNGSTETLESRRRSLALGPSGLHVKASCYPKHSRRRLFIMNEKLPYEKVSSQVKNSLVSCFSDVMSLPVNSPDIRKVCILLLLLPPHFRKCAKALCDVTKDNETSLIPLPG